MHDAGRPRTEQARRLRREQTVGERVVWAELRKLKQGWRRQAPIGPYIVDFVRHEIGLIIEIDGPVHGFEGRAERDSVRQAWLEAKGYAVLRFADAEARNRTDQLLQTILTHRPRPRPSSTWRGAARYDLR